MAEYKLTYFNVKAVAEPIRFIFHYAGVDFEDIRVSTEDWPNLKPTAKWGQLPFLTFGDFQLTQSATICRFLAKKFNLAGENDLESARVDELVDAMKDVMLGKVYKEEDPEKKKEFAKEIIAEMINPRLAKMSQLQEENGGDWLVGKNVTWADFFVACGFDFWANATEINILADFPILVAHQQRVFDLPQIKAWIEKRPENPM